jgi:hypothetical protein
MDDPINVYRPMFARAAGGIRAARTFSEPQPRHFRWHRTCTRDEWLDQRPTQPCSTRSRLTS